MTITSDKIAQPLVNLEGIADRLLGPHPGVRDQEGYLVHPALPVFDESCRVDLFLASLGLEAGFVLLDNDEAVADEHKEWVADGGSCLSWQPMPPQGEDWVLLEIYPTEDGPCALFARRVGYDAAMGWKLTHTDRMGRVAEWRCFHCGELFTNNLLAADHFGYSEYATPACKIDAAQYREMEQRVARANADDSDTDRAMYALRSEHENALRRAEEAGYGKGVSDMQTVGIDGFVMAPHYRGYARLGSGQYMLQHSAKGEPAELIISIASEAQKAEREIGEVRETPTPPPLVYPEEMAVRIEFTTAQALFALEQQLTFLREEHFRPAQMVSPDEAQKLAIAAVTKYLLQCGCSLNEQAADAVMKLTSVAGLMTINFVGQQQAVERMLGTAAHIGKPQFKEN